MLIIPPNSNSYGPNDVVILDTQEGDLWKWYQYGGYPNSPENSSAIMYLGRAKPGAKPGDVVDKYAHPATPSAGQTEGLPKTGDRKRGSVDRGSVRFFDPKSCPQPDLLAMLKLS